MTSPPTTPGDSLGNPLQLFLGIIKTIQGLSGLAIGASPSLGLVRPDLLSAIGLSSAIQPLFNVLTILISAYFLQKYLAQYATDKVSAKTLGQIQQSSARQLGIGIGALALYYFLGAVTERLLTSPAIGQFSQFIFLALALPPAIAFSSIARSLVLTAIRIRLAPHVGRRTPAA